MSTGASDSVLDDILAAAEFMTVSDTSPPPSPGLARTPVTRGAFRRGGGWVQKVQFHLSCFRLLTLIVPI